MNKHYRVQSVLLSANQSVALTLTPVDWVIPDPNAGVDDEGIPNGWVDAEPEDEGAEPCDGDGKMTELRMQSSDPMFLPNEYVSLTVERTTHTYKGED